MAGLSTHVLDTARGLPAAGVPVALLRWEEGAFVAQGGGTTDADGRVRDLLPTLAAGRYQLRFDTGAYFAAQGITGFYPEVSITFDVADAGRHHHVPLLVSPYGYSTYRGS